MVILRQPGIRAGITTALWAFLRAFSQTSLRALAGLWVEIGAVTKAFVSGPTVHHHLGTQVTLGVPPQPIAIARVPASDGLRWSIDFCPQGGRAFRRHHSPPGERTAAR